LDVYEENGRFQNVVSITMRCRFAPTAYPSSRGILGGGRLPHELHVGRRQAIGVVDGIAEMALQAVGFCAEGLERPDNPSIPVP
jgi:hypothetical protein